MSRLRTLLAEPSYWSEVLAACTYRGYRPDDLTAAEETFQNLTAEQVQEIWARYATPDRAISVTLRPAK